MGFPQRLLADDERLVLVLRRHVKALFVPVVLGVLVLAVAGGLSYLVPEGDARLWLWLVIDGVAAIVLLRWVVWPFMVWRSAIHVVTTRRLILRSGVFNRQGHDMPLSRINDVSFEHTLWDRMLGCGTLVVESAGERGQLTLDDVPKVELVQRTLYRLADELRGHRGPDVVDDDLARTLDDAFDEEYHAPQSGHGSPER